MSNSVFVSGTPQPKFPFLERWRDKLWIMGLLLAALVLLGINLGGVALRDWDEGIVAQVAREISRGDWNWLYPQINDTPYQNKPPLVHWLISGCYAIGGIHEWTARLPSALLTAFSVPLLYGIGKELFHQRTPAIFAALVYLTLLPVVRQGRLAMLEGSVLCFFLLMIWCVLQARRDLRYALAAGISFGLLCFTKGILLGGLLGAIVFLFLLWDTPRILTAKYLWMGLLLGSGPVIAWYLAQWLHYGPEFVQANLVHQSLRRIWEPVGSHEGPPWYYLLEILKFSGPWLLFLPQGLQLTWENRNLSWGKLLLVWIGVYFITISVMDTKLPWYILPIYPALALVIGCQMAQVWEQTPLDLGQPFPPKWIAAKPMIHSIRHRENFPTPDLETETSSYPLIWTLILALISLIAWLGFAASLAGMELPGLNLELEVNVQLMLAAIALTSTFATVLVYQKDRQFLLVLLWGMYLSLLLLMSSNSWVWELGEDYPVKPVAAMIAKNTAADQSIYTSHPYPRPSLNFYSDRLVKVANLKKLKEEWYDESTPYLLLDKSTLKQLNFNHVKVMGTAEGWLLVTRQPS